MRSPLHLLVCLLAASGLGGCSIIKGVAINAVADALSGNGDTFASDEDPELVRDAIPFGLKTYESVLQSVPEHRGLLLAAASGFTQYGYAFVALEADRVEEDDLKRARELRLRARKLFLRGRDYALRGLDAAHPGFSKIVLEDPARALAGTTVEDAGLLYWCGVSWGAALMVGKDDLNLVADLPLSGALVGRVLELQEGFGAGAAHEFLITFDGSRPDAMGGSASVHLALAESVCIREQNPAEFRSLLKAARAVDPDAVPSQRLVNVLARRRADFLESRIPDLFVDPEGEEKKQ
jgi:predicted anti-sigma-YlaC factor YlaD